VISEVTEVFHHRQHSTSRGTINRSVHRDGLLLLPCASRLRLRRSRVSEPRRAPTLHCTQGEEVSPVFRHRLDLCGQGTGNCGRGFEPPTAVFRQPPSPDEVSAIYATDRVRIAIRFASGHGLSSRRACEAEGTSVVPLRSYEQGL
jgi:hypothetical protein